MRRFPRDHEPRCHDRPGLDGPGRGVNGAAPGSLHHVELWVPNLPRAAAEWGWLLGELGYAPFQDWPQGRSWRLGAT